MVQLAIQKCLEKEALCNEFYLQLIKQTTDQPEPNGRINIQNWRLMCLVCGVVVPRNRVILSYLQAHLRRCGIEAHTEEGKFGQFALQVSMCVCVVGGGDNGCFIAANNAGLFVLVFSQGQSISPF